MDSEVLRHLLALLKNTSKVLEILLETVMHYQCHHEVTLEKVFGYDEEAMVTPSKKKRLSLMM